MKRMVCGMLALALVLAVGCALADRQVNLPESRYVLMIPDEMEYDGPTPDTDEVFAYVSDKLGLQISFLLYNAPGANLASFIPKIQAKNPEDVQLTTVGGVSMIVYRMNADGAKSIGYILQDGDRIHEIVFWYMSQTGADLSKTIMESIQ